MMAVRGRRRVAIGPLILSFVSRGFLDWRLSSWGVKVWRWSWNSRTDRQRFDVPGPWTWTENKEGEQR